MIFKLWMEDALYAKVMKILYYYILVITILTQTIELFIKFLSCSILILSFN